LGFRHRKKVDYSDTFSPVAHYDSTRLLLAIAAAKNFELWQFDVSIAFFSGDIDETIYMEQPEGCVDGEHSECVCRLQRTIYGLRDRGLQFSKMCDALEDIGLISIHNDRCIFSRRVGDNIVCMALYVDDAILASPSGRAGDRNAFRDFRVEDKRSDNIRGNRD